MRKDCAVEDAKHANQGDWLQQILGVGVYLGMRIRVLCLMVVLMGMRASGQTVSEQYLLAAANADRAAHGLGPVRRDEHLELAARGHAYEMAKRGTISHQFEGEEDLAERAGDAGAHFSLITENVAEASNSALIHDLWMHSAGHRANLLDPAVDAVGIAVVQVHGQLYAVEDFGKTVQTLSLSEQETTVAGLLADRGVALVAGRGEARQTCEMSTGYAGGRQPWFVMRYTSSDIGRLPPELTTRLESGKYHQAAVGACVNGKQGPFTSYNLAVLLYP